MNEQINKGDTLQKLRLAVNENIEKLNRIPDNFASTTVSPNLALEANSWVEKTQTIPYTHDVSMRNSIDVNSDSLNTWSECGVKAISETADSITFTCETIPTTDLSFIVTSTSIV